MTLKRRKQPNIAVGTTKLVHKFAWLPTTIAGITIWLEQYQILQAYINNTYLLTVDDKSISMSVSNWIVISKRLIS